MRLRRNDDRHLRAAAVTRELHPIDQPRGCDRPVSGPERFTSPFSSMANGLDQLQVGMLARGDVMAAGARAARKAIGARRLAQQRARKIQRQTCACRCRAARRAAAHAASVARARERFAQRLRVATDSSSGQRATLRHRRSPFTRHRSIGSEQTRRGPQRTSGIGRAAFTTRKRAGSERRARDRPCARARRTRIPRVRTCRGCVPWPAARSRRSRDTAIGTSNRIVRSGRQSTGMKCSSSAMRAGATPCPPP